MVGKEFTLKSFAYQVAVAKVKVENRKRSKKITAKDVKYIINALKAPDVNLFLKII